jgi:rRNA processing protein Gar1
MILVFGPVESIYADIRVGEGVEGKEPC